MPFIFLKQRELGLIACGLSQGEDLFDLTRLRPVAFSIPADSGPIDPRVENAPPIDEPFCPRKRRKNLSNFNGVRIVCTHFFKRF